jgi:PDGLE domain
MRRASVVAFTVLALAASVGLSFAASPYASSSPDGLEKVAEDKGFLADGRLASVQEDSPLPDYAFPGIADERLAAGLAGLVGTLGVFAVALALAYFLRRRAASGEA